MITPKYIIKHNAMCFIKVDFDNIGKVKDILFDYGFEENVDYTITWDDVAKQNCLKFNNEDGLGEIYGKFYEGEIITVLEDHSVIYVDPLVLYKLFNVQLENDLN